LAIRLSYNVTESHFFGSAMSGDTGIFEGGI
jgi:hypothetical protein